MDKYGLIGHPLMHSFSRGFFNEKFNSENIDAEYINFDIPNVDMVKAILKENPTLKGLNVTIPYKEQIIPYLDDISDNAKLIGAINVIKIDRVKGKIRLKGHNSDIIGFQRSIEALIPQEENCKALVLGTGGSAKAIYYGLEQLDVKPTYVSRTEKPGALTYGELTEDVMKNHKIIVNCTPVGMWPHTDECPDIPYQYLTSEHLLYDLLYNPNETLFMVKGKNQGAMVKNGLEMLILQAFVSWDIWQGHRK